jgi:hypothetical protein
MKQAARKAGGAMFLRNVCWLSTDYMALYPRIKKSSFKLVDNFLGRQKAPNYRQSDDEMLEVYKIKG